MKTWQKMAIPTLIMVGVGGIYLFSVWKQRQDPGVIARNSQPAPKVTMDDVAVVRTLSPAHFQDTRALEGTSVWMKDGYTMPYYSFTAGHVDFSRRAGLIPATQRLEVNKIVKQAVPSWVDDAIEHGSRQVFVLFSLPGGQRSFATPIGSMQGDREVYYTDLLFYYDDPHKIYSNWPKNVWAAIDAHQVKPGMSELQARMAVGESMRPDRSTEGDRTVTYNQAGKHWTVTFVKDQATEIKTG
jgi:hypothetical protein